MKVTTEQLERRRLAVRIEVEEERVQRELQATARRLSRVRPFPGFRPGRAPLAVLLRRLGKEAVYDAMLDEIGDTLYQEAVEQLDIKPLARAQLDDVQLEPLVLKLTVPLEPLVELSDYRSLRLEPPLVSISDQEVENALADLQEQTARWEPVSRPAQTGDLAVMALEGTNQAGERVVNEERASLRLSLDSPLPTLQDQLLGMQIEEEREFDFTYPQEFANHDLSGQTLHFRARLLEVRERVLAPLSDEWARTVGDYASLDDLRLGLRGQLEAQKGRESEAEYAQQVVAALVGQAKVDYPEELVERTLDQMLSERDRMLQRQGTNLDLSLKVEGKTREQLREELRQEAEERLKRSLVLTRVAGEEKLAVTPAEVTSYTRLVSSTYGEQADEVRRVLLASGSFQESVRQDLLADKAVGRMVSIAKGEVDIMEQATGGQESSSGSEASGPEGVAEPAETADGGLPSADESSSG